MQINSNTFSNRANLKEIKLKIKDYKILEPIFINCSIPQYLIEKDNKKYVLKLIEKKKI
jgi:hypothetical protein